VEPAHFDWRWRERPALALLAWEALARDPLARLCRIQVESIGTTINFRPAAITHRDIAASALLIASMLALTAAVDALQRRRYLGQLEAPHIAWASLPRGGKGRLSTRVALRDVFGKNPNSFRFAFDIAIEPVGGKLFDLIAKFQELSITI
jgi:hypothetical protein